MHESVDGSIQGMDERERDKDEFFHDSTKSPNDLTNSGGYPGVVQI